MTSRWNTGSVDVIVTIATGNAVAAMRATTEIPIVMLASGYPVEVGLVKSYARPGGNVTGNSIYAGTELFVFRTTIARIFAASPTSSGWPRRCMSS